ncbi:MAG: ArsR family transcriptional regulator, partial [Mycobacterium sp.]
RQVMVASMHIGKSLTDNEIVEHARALVTTADAVSARLSGGDRLTIRGQSAPR